MLTIQKPLMLQSGKDIRALPQKLNNTIEKNYTIIREDFTAQDLLFLLVNPQDVVAAETNLNNTNVFNSSVSNHKLSVEVLNNFVNRITNYGTADFTYQDSVYVTNILSKLGITNVSEFMKAVRNISENAENISRLINAYSENIEMLKLQNTQYVSQNTSVTKAEEGDHVHKSRYYLQNEIFNRLQTENIYETVYNFSKPSNRYVSNISNDTMLISEQTNVFRQLKLMQLKQEAGVLDESVYNSLTNIYEKHENSRGEITRESILSGGAAAALVNLVGNITVNKLQENISANTWVNAEKSFYGAAENSIKRFELLTEENSLNLLKNDIDIEEVNNNYRQETEAILNNIQNLQNIYNAAAKVYPEGDTLYNSRQNLLYRNDTTVSEQTLNVTPEQVTENYSELQNEITNVNTVQDFRSQDFMTQLRNLNERNVRIQNEVNKIINEQQVAQKPVVKIDRKSLMNAALKAMEEPEKAISEFFSEVKIEKPENNILNLYPQLESLDPDTRKIYETILFIHNDPQKAIDDGIVASGNMGMLMSDLAEANRASEENPPEDYVPAPMEMLRTESIYDRESIETITKETEAKRAEENRRLDSEIEKKAVQAVENHITVTAGHEQKKDVPFEPAVMLERIEESNDFSEIRNINRNIIEQKRQKETVLEKEMEKALQQIITKERDDYKKAASAGKREPFEPASIVNVNNEKTDVTIENVHMQGEAGAVSAPAKAGKRGASKKQADMVHKDTDTTAPLISETEILRQAGIVRDNVISEAVSTVHETITPIERRTVKTEREVQQFHKEAPIVHKRVNDISDEILEEINRVKTTKSEQTVQQTIEKNIELDKVQINNISEQVIEKTGRKIEKTIEKSVSDQLDELTDKVYDQIERRLRDERSRRGY
ncbi:MAG: hypothetical protein K6F52_06785 [Clostridia bacterium]|nr:hypothetical protein [Clostridia bacterium]